MANILLPPQRIDLAALESQFPGPPFVNKKVFFQLELRNRTGAGDLVFGVIAYPAWRRGNAPRERWIIGNKVAGIDLVPPPIAIPTIPILPPVIAFGNNEILLWLPLKSDEKKKDEYAIQNEKFLDLYNTIIKDKEKLAKSFFSTGKVRVTDNPHLDYDVTLTDGSTSTNVTTNPCPPNQPGE